jgi:RHS repeat-associated protein
MRLVSVGPIRVDRSSRRHRLGRAVQGLGASQGGLATRRARRGSRARFGSRVSISTKGLHYNRHRYYDPHAGRFISSDPIGLHGGLNLHGYAPNPIDWVDQLGLSGSAAQRRKQRRAQERAAASSCPTAAGRKLPEYAPRIRQRAVDPGGHNFPFFT